MKRLIVIGVCIILICSYLYLIPKESTLPFKNETRNQYHVTMQLHPEAHYYEANVIISFKNTSNDSWNEVVLRDYPSQFIDEAGGGISQISSVYDEQSGTTLDYQRDEDPTIVRIALNTPLLPNQTLTISFYYQASIPDLEARFGYVEKTEGKLDLYLGNSLPILAIYENGQWITDPYFNVGECFYSDISDYKVQVSAPIEYTLIGTGEVSTNHLDDTTQTLTYNAKSVRDFCLIAGNDYRRISYMKDGIHYCSYYHSENSQVGLEALINLEASVNQMSSILGKYPYKTINTVETYTQMQGMEYPQLIMIADSMMGNPSTIRHEIVHQWFYGIVGNNSYQEAWLDESIATYLAEEEIKGYQSIISEPYNSYSQDADYTYAMYFSGGSMYTALADEFGKNHLYMLLHDFIVEHAYSEVKTNDMLVMLMKEFGQASLPILAPYFSEEILQEAKAIAFTDEYQ